jgi:hypothetical protein
MVVYGSTSAPTTFHEEITAPPPAPDFIPESSGGRIGGFQPPAPAPVQYAAAPVAAPIPAPAPAPFAAPVAAPFAAPTTAMAMAPQPTMGAMQSGFEH